MENLSLAPPTARAGAASSSPSKHSFPHRIVPPSYVEPEDWNDGDLEVPEGGLSLPASQHSYPTSELGADDFSNFDEISHGDHPLQSTNTHFLSGHDADDRIQDEVEGEEDWDHELEVDFDLGPYPERSLSAKGRDGPQDDPEENLDEDQVETIKASSLLGGALDQLRALKKVSPGSIVGTVTQLGAGAGTSDLALRAKSSEGFDWDEDIVIPDSLPSHVPCLHQMRPSEDLDLDDFEADGPGDTHGKANANAKQPAKLEYAAPQCFPPHQKVETSQTLEKSPKYQVPSSAQGGSSVSSDTSSLLSPPRRFPGSGTLSSCNQDPDTETDPELDFDLDPSLEKLEISPAIARQKSNSTLDQERLHWGDLASNRSSSPDAGSHPGWSASDASAATSGSTPQESDADDEGNEDLLGGLVLSDSVFGPEGNNHSESVGHLVRAKLEAMLDARRKGLASPDNIGSGELGRPKLDSENDLAVGLVITDDLDLSPSRLHAKRLSFRIRSTNEPSPMSNLSQRSRRPPQLMSVSPQGSIKSHAAPRRSTLPPQSSAGPTAAQQVARTSQHHQSYSSPIMHDFSHTVASRMNQARDGSGSRCSLRRKISTSDLQASGTQDSSIGSRPKTLARKRSLPSVDDRRPAVGDHDTSASPAKAAGQATSSRLMSSTAASRARAAETAADLMARSVQPARPITPGALPSKQSEATRLNFWTRGRSGGAPESQGPYSPAESISPRPSSLCARMSPAQVLKHPRGRHAYGDGHELDGFDDLPTNSEKETGFRNNFAGGHGGMSAASSQNSIHGMGLSADAGTSRWKALRSNLSSSTTQVKERRSTGSSPSTNASNTTGHQPNRPNRGNRKRKGAKAKPTLIRNLGGSPASPRVVGNMRWNPKAQRWEGNESALRDFDNAVQNSSRPALITQLTGSSTSSHYTHSIASPQSSLAASSLPGGTRIVGEMMFDPIQMKWLHRNGDETDIFANIDEEGGLSDDPLSAASNLESSSAIPSSVMDQLSFASGVEAGKDGTIKARRIKSADVFVRIDESSSLGMAEGAKSPKVQHSTRSTKSVVGCLIDSSLKDGTFPTLEGVDEELWNACIEAESRHRHEMKGFLPRGSVRSKGDSSQSMRSAEAIWQDIDAPRDHLYLLQRLARQAGR
ncbi:hypothetical protein IE53DRAFT_96900 [Violaceomyces palustris]|uniref:Uncharacterized protein n=1 Tax=Violaceomyces palustris TaxID=1673888 RepID=A0ACD0NX58_9BASI|nr:hypothetical protein IE53DRAFT_96900 [Violaceomyces palustris]